MGMNVCNDQNELVNELSLRLQSTLNLKTSTSVLSLSRRVKIVGKSHGLRFSHL
jgi:hypothetical protein